MTITIIFLGDMTPCILSDRYRHFGVHTKIRENRSTFSKVEMGKAQTHTHTNTQTEYSPYGKKEFLQNRIQYGKG
jgi:hypothetical protein